MRKLLVGVSAIALTTPAAAFAQTTTEPAAPASAAKQPAPAEAATQAEPLSPTAPTAQSTSPTADEATTAASETDGEIVVTGSRVVRNGYQAPTPVTVVGEEQLQEQAITRLVDITRTLPQFRVQGGARSGSNSSAFGGQGSLNLRGLGANRNLILLDRRRVVPSTGNGVVDVNILPTALVQRIDVVTGGASAAWGSDAVSGVVNFVLDTRLQGVKAEITGGISAHGDNEEGNFLLAGGTKLGDRAHVIASVEYYTGGSQRLVDRDWLARKPGIINNPDATAANGQPRRLVVEEGIVAAHMTRGGLVNSCRAPNGTTIANCALRGTAFGPGGTPYAFQYGTFVNRAGNMIAPPGTDYFNDYTSIYDGINVTNASERLSLFGHLEYELTDGITGFVEGIYTDSKIGPSFTVPPYRFGTTAANRISIRADNAYLPASVRSTMLANGIGFLDVGRINDDWFGNSRVENTNTTYRGVAGLKGDLGGGWKFDGYYQYGRNTYFGTVEGNLIVSRGGVAANGNFNLAVDAVGAPAGNAAGIPAGTIVCRSTLTNPNNGCQPLNIFGVGAASQAAIDYVTDTQFTRQRYEQHVVEGSVSGEPFDTWAGPVSLAAGASYRAEKINAVSDPLSLERAFHIGNPQPYSGDFDVKEAFAEVVVPLAKDASFAKLLDITAAGRITDYSTSGSVFTWKAGATYEPFDDLRLRFTRSRDIRAASLQELYTGQVQARVNVTDNGVANNGVFQFTGGNPELDPEVADTLSGGIVYSPSFLPGLTASIDYYDIKIKDVIGTISAQEIVNRCNAGDTVLCSQITRTGGAITEIRATNVNLASLKTSGLDIEASYRTDLSWGGSVGIRALVGYVDTFETSDGRTVLELAGSIGPGSPQPALPHWTGLLSYNYARGPFRGTVVHRYIGSAVIDNQFRAPGEIDDNRVASRIYTNLNLSYEIEGVGKGSEMYLNVENIFNVKPPRGFGWGYGLEASPTYDVIGIMFKGGVRLRF